MANMKNSKFDLSRRQFLSKSILATAALPLAQILGSSTAHAAGTVAPLRLIQIMTPFEFSEAFYHPQVSSTNSSLAPNGSSFYIPPNSSLAPLAPFLSGH
jgi:hypothetical protein